MKLERTSTMGRRPSWKKFCQGSSLAELSIAIGLSSLVLIALSSIYLYSARTFVVLENHLHLDNASRLAMDQISQEIRQSDGLVSHNTNTLTIKLKGQTVSYSYHSGTRALVRQNTGSGATRVVLKDCDFFRYEIFQRTPSNSVYGFFPTATVDSCKVIRMTWLCSRGVGDQFNNSSTMRSAQVVLRNQSL